MTTIVDPTDTNVAIVDGEVAYALRLADVAEPARPTVAELKAARIVGYGHLG